MQQVHTASPHPQAVLRFVCDMAFGGDAPGSGGRLASAFYAVVVCEVLACTAAVTEPLVALLVPYLQQGLRPAAAADQRVASHMVIAQLMTRATLSRVLLEGAPATSAKIPRRPASHDLVAAQGCSRWSAVTQQANVDRADPHASQCR